MVVNNQFGLRTRDMFSFANKISIQVSRLVLNINNKTIAITLSLKLQRYCCWQRFNDTDDEGDDVDKLA